LSVGPRKISGMPGFGDPGGYQRWSGNRGRVYCSPRVIRCVRVRARVCVYAVYTRIPRVLFPTATSECFTDNEPIMYYIIAGARNTVVVVVVYCVFCYYYYYYYYTNKSTTHLPLCIFLYTSLSRTRTHKHTHLI